MSRIDNLWKDAKLIILLIILKSKASIFCLIIGGGGGAYLTVGLVSTGGSVCFLQPQMDEAGCRCSGTTFAPEFPGQVKSPDKTVNRLWVYTLVDTHGPIKLEEQSIHHPMVHPTGAGGAGQIIITLT